MNDQTDGKTVPEAGARHAPIVFEGYIGEINDDRVVVFPCLDRHYSIEIRRRDVIDFEAGHGNGACRFVVSGTASVLERITVMTTTRRAKSASDITWRLGAGALEGEDLGGWTQETDWTRPD